MSTIGADDLPLLNEPLPVELANSWYAGEDGEAIDFLGTPALVQLWFATASVAAHLELPTPLGEAHAADIRGLRDVIRALLEALLAGSAPSGDTTDLANRYAARAPSRPVLRWTPLGFHTERVHAGTLIDALVTQIATAAIDFVVGSSVSRLRRCAGLGCGMFYVQDHHLRRWCHPSCGHRARQARYFHRKNHPLPPSELS